MLVDPTDPLVFHFALQHDLRERFLHAIEESIEALEMGEHESALLLLREAVDRRRITEWIEADRPLPWIDTYLAEPTQQVNEVIQRIFESGAEPREQ